MNNNDDLLLSLAAKCSLNVSEFSRVETAGHEVYSNGRVYIKFGNKDEAELVRSVYPSDFLGMLQVRGVCAFAVKNLGRQVSEQDFSGELFSSWMSEIRRISSMNPAIRPDKLMIATEVSLITSAMTQDDYNIQPYIDELTARTPDYSSAKQVFLQGDPNFRNVVFDDSQEAHLVDFDHAKLGPLEWDIANVLMVCLIANRNDLYELGQKEFVDADTQLVRSFMGIRLAQTLVHTVGHMGFEGVDGLERRKSVVKDFLKSKNKVA